MKETELYAIVDQLVSHIPKELNGADMADIYAHLGKEIGLSHLLLPEARPDRLYDIELPTNAPEKYSDRLIRSETAVSFIARVYEPWLGNGLGQHHLRHLDHGLYHAMHNWLRNNEMPDWLDLPSKKDLNTRELKMIGLEDGDTLPYPSYYRGLKDKLRLYNAARNRSKKSN